MSQLFGHLWARRSRLFRASTAASGLGAPVAGGVPTIDNVAPTVGNYLTGTPPAFTGIVTGYRYAWKRVMVGAPFTETAIPFADGTLAFVQPIAATETIRFGVQAYGPGGDSAWVWSAATAAVARAYVSAVVASQGVWWPWAGVVAGYAGAPIDLIMDGSTFSVPQDAKGLLQIEGVGGAREWWMARASYTGLGGVMPRVSKIYQQGSFAGAHMLQPTDNLRPVFDFNLINEDGSVPLSINGYNARDTTQAGATLASTEANTWMRVAAGTLLMDQSNFTVNIVMEGAGNVASATGQNTLWAMRHVTAANNFALRCGGDSWTANFGLGVTNGAAVVAPPSRLQTPATRSLVSVTMTTNPANSIDGQVPAAGSVYNVRVNNDTAQQYTAAIAGRTDGLTGASQGLGIGINGAQALATGTAYAFYGMTAITSSLSTGLGGSVVDRRDAYYASLMAVGGVRNDSTTNLICFGSSTASGYQGSAGNSFMSRLSRLVGPKLRTASYSRAGAGCSVHFEPNKVLLSQQALAGKRNIAFIYTLSTDVSAAALTAAQTYASFKAFIDQLNASGNFYKIYVGTFVCPSYTASVAHGGPAGTIVVHEQANDLIRLPANQLADNYTCIDITGLHPELVRTDPVYMDSGAHLRTETGHGVIASTVAAALAADLV